MIHKTRPGKVPASSVSRMVGAGVSGEEQLTEVGLSIVIEVKDVAFVEI
jgi:hypothetical protein